MEHHTRVCIDLRAYENNIRQYISTLAASSKLCAVVKADAYGHGLKKIAPRALAAGASSLAIVDNWEAHALREVGLDCRIVRLRPALRDEILEALPWRVEEICGSFEHAQMVSSLPQSHHPIPVHIELDIGMGRMGFSLPSQHDELLKVCQMPKLEIRGIMAHFPCADEEDQQITNEHLQQFLNHVHELSEILPSDIVIHIANSAAFLRIPTSHYKMVRLGIATYGLFPSCHVPLSKYIQPVMKWVTRVVLLRDMPKGASIGYGMTHRLPKDSLIATLPLGYADGYLRDFSNNAEVLIRGKRCPVVGRVSMDMITVDVSHLPEVQCGDEAVLLGHQGKSIITAEELAHRANTINYEIACLIGKCNPIKEYYG